mmetsp:Transcript_2512/g.3672  ORF Transcript_2512/g.3672 Transcript_2512/m.3672 type:complete len:254 (+) Transcript_2512:705-1466(+)
MMQAKVDTDENIAVAVTKDFSFKPSEDAKDVFEILKASGLKKNKKAENLVVDIFDHTKLFPANIGLCVEANLARKKDRSLPHRVKLAGDVQETILTELQTAFPGGLRSGTLDKKDNDFEGVICVEVLLVSDGSSLGRRFSAKNGVGTAKLTVAYCLQSAKSGKVAAANQLHVREDCAPGKDDISYWEYCSAVVRSMARKVAGDIAEEVTSDMVSWKMQKKEHEKLRNAVEIKLGNEDNLDDDEYRFAVENHMF